MRPSFSRNIPLFIGFRVAFNARWYYPVLAVLFLDFGLSIDQYALLNVAWAISIVLLEVPSGALADLIGRRRILILAALLMIVEMSLLAFVPLGSALIFPAFLLNRILSGAAEACASGADESLAYDSLAAAERVTQWPAVLTRLMRWQSLAFFVAMLLGAAVYDPHLVARVLAWLGIDAHITAATTLRWPIYLTLANAVAALCFTLKMTEPSDNPAPRAAADQPGISAHDTWRQILAAGRWIAASPTVLFVILFGLCVDSVIRLFLTVGSNYYRLIELPEASFGLIGSTSALLGFFTPRLAQSMVARRSMNANFLWVCGLTLLGLCGVSQFWRHWGVICVIPLGISMALLQFFLSHYLNHFVTDSQQRATILSFKGLAFNLAYGALGLAFAWMTRDHRSPQDAVFKQAMNWLPYYFAALGLGLLCLRLKLLPARPAKSPTEI